MGHSDHRVLRFDRFELNLTRGCLRVDGRGIEVRPKAFEILRYLVENAGRLIPKQELCEAVWPHVAVSDDSLVQCIRELRQKLGDEDHRLIKTVARRGYLLDANVTVQEPRSSDELTAKVPDGSLGAPAKRGRGWLQAIVAQKPSVWVAAAACFGGVTVGTLYLFGLPVSITSLAPVGVTASASVAGRPLSMFKDCKDCPEMVALPAGEFMMGSPESEFERRETERPPRRVVIARRFAIGRFEITMDQFSAFVADAGMAVGDKCRKIVGLSGASARWGAPEVSFRRPGFEVTGRHPVVCVSWHDAQAYVAWLSRRTGKPYRLPTEAEWEYAARAGTKTRYSFGNDFTELCAYAKFADLGSPFGWRGGCRSDIATYGTIPVGSLKPNPWGLFDVHGNVWEWVEDCWTPSAMEIPTDGSAFSRPGCEMGVIRGGSWAAGFGRSGSASRWPTPAAEHYQHVGFRVAIPL
jgi:formylglycine-generating enzyme required for sulfatase activity/DNA-binding winged helix-turn-helix (wHTH) protein